MTWSVWAPDVCLQVHDCAHGDTAAQLLPVWVSVTGLCALAAYRRARASRHTHQQQKLPKQEWAERHGCAAVSLWSLLPFYETRGGCKEKGGKRSIAHAQDLMKGVVTYVNESCNKSHTMKKYFEISIINYSQKRIESDDSWIIINQGNPFLSCFSCSG